MTLDEFLPLLSDGNWELDGSDIRCGTFCPVTYVAHKLTGKEWKEYQFDSAGDAINLDRYLLSDIVCAADAFLNIPERKEIRKKLLEACKLKEEYE